MTFKRKKADEFQITDVPREVIEAAMAWKPENRQFSGTDYYKQHGKAPPGCKVFIKGRIINDKGEDERSHMAPNDPNRGPKPKGWA